MDELYFNNDWMTREPLHTHMVDATMQILNEYCHGDPVHIDTMSGLLYHFASCWYQAILEGGGMLVEPAVRSCALFTAHMIHDHGMPEAQQFGCVALLTRFVSIVITRAGGRLL